VFAALALAAAAGAAQLAARGAPAPAARLAGASQAGASHVSRAGTRLWVARYQGTRNNNISNDSAACCVAVSPSGKLVFVTGYSNGKYSLDWATIAYRAATGAQVWRKRYNDRDNLADSASGLAVSPGGRTVYVTGYSTGKISGQDYLTVAYNAATGAMRWQRHYNGPGNGMDAANAVAVSPNGSRVYVIGGSAGSATEGDYATLSYSAASGRQLWVRRYKSPGGIGSATSVAVSPRGDKVFVAGSSMGKTSNSGYATVGYSAASGRQLWVRRYNSLGSGPAQALSVAVGPGGSTVFVTGYTDGANNAQQFTTIAYDSASGATRWLRSYDGPYNGPDGATKLAVSPSGHTVFVTGSSYGKTSTHNYTTIAYNAASGSTIWRRQYVGPDVSSQANSVAVSPGGKIVYVTGVSYAPRAGNDFATIAYNAATGAQMWVRRYNGPANNNDGASSVAVSRVTGAVYVTGESLGRSGAEDYLTIGYSG
jgi:WD40 repeat protein